MKQGDFPLGVEYVIKALGISRMTFYRLLRDKQLSAKKLRGRTVVLQSELTRYLHNLPDFVYGEDFRDR